MALLKRTYALPGEVLEDFEKLVPAAERTAVLTGLLQAWLEQQKRAELRRQVIEGCEEMAEIYLEVEREYHPLEEEIHRALDVQSKTRRRRAGKT